MAADWTHLPGDGLVFLGLSALLCFIGVVCFAARTYTNRSCTKRFFADYWLSLLTFVLCIISQAYFVVAIEFGLGAHAHDLSPSDMVVALRTTWISQISGIVAAVTGKLSVIAFLDQIRGRHRGRPWFLYFVGASNIVVNVIVVIIILLQCTPLEKLWDDKVAGNCDLRPVNTYYAYFQGSYSALSDAILALYPIPLIATLQVSARMKLGLSSLLGLGMLAAVTSVTKTVQVTNLAHDDEGLDITFYIARLALATIVEAWIVLTVGCIPTLRPLIKAAVQRMRGTSTTKQTSQLVVDKYGMQPVSAVNRLRMSRNVPTGRRAQKIELSTGQSKESHGSKMSTSEEADKAIVVVTDVQISYEGREVVTEEDEARREIERRLEASSPV